MRHAAEKEKPLKPHLTPRHKVWLNWDGLFLMGPNYLRFLAAVDQTGTIREGGLVVGWSYRTCLNRLRRMEQVLGRPGRQDRWRCSTHPRSTTLGPDLLRVATRGGAAQSSGLRPGRQGNDQSIGTMLPLAPRRTTLP